MKRGPKRNARPGDPLRSILQWRTRKSFTFVESKAFERARPVYLDDDEYAELQGFVLLSPETGSVVPGSGGVRKMRWRIQGSGKRGGLRVIYFVSIEKRQVWMLTVYSKAKYDSIPGRMLKRLLEEFCDA